MKYFFRTFLSLVLLGIPVSALACSCYMQWGKQPIQEYPIIVDGTAVKTYVYEAANNSPRHFASICTTFKINTVYKGIVAETIDVCYGTSGSMCGINPYQDGENVILFTRKGSEGFYSTSLCTPTLRVDIMNKYPSNYSYQFKTLNELGSFKSKFDNLDAEITRTGDREQYLLKGQLLEEYKDYDRAVNTYKEAIAKASSQKSFLQTLTGSSSLQKIYQNLLEDPYSSSAGTQISDEIIFGYGRALYYSGKFKEALKPLGMIAGDEAKQLYTSALMQTDQKQSLNGTALIIPNKKQDEIILKDLQLPNSDLSGSQYQKGDFTNAALEKSNFSKTIFYRITAINSNFSGSDFSGAKIRGGDMSNSNLSFTDFTGSQIHGLSLKDSNLEGANLSDSKIEGSFEGANLKDANLKNARIFKLKGAKLENTKLDGISSRDGEFSFTSSDYSEVDLSNQNLSGSVLSNTYLTRSKFINSNLSKADLRRADLQGADFSNADLSDADMRSMADFQLDIPGTDLRDANLSTANLSGTNLAAALYNCRTKFPMNFDPVKAHMIAVWDSCEGIRPDIDLSIVDKRGYRPQLKEYDQYIYDQYTPLSVKKADLSGAVFDNAEMIFICYFCNLSGAKFRNAQLKGEFRASDLRGADFSGATFGQDFRFHESDLRGTNFSGARFVGRPMLHEAKYDETTTWPSNFQPPSSRGKM